MKTHELKVDQDAFDAVQDGCKTFEIRKADREFRVGDAILLRCTFYTGAEMAAGSPLIYTGETARRIITHILRGPIFGLADEWAILSLHDVAATQAALDAEFRAYFRGLLAQSPALRRYARRTSAEIGGITLPVFRSALADAFRAGRELPRRTI